MKNVPSVDFSFVWPNLPDVRKLLGWDYVKPLSEKMSENLEKRLKRLDWTFTLISGFVVVLTGLSVLYLGKASFGSASDYASVLLWGTAVDEGLKVARRLVPSQVLRLVGG